MTHSLHPAAQKGFSSAAERYQQARPSYPLALVDWLTHDLEICAESHVVDLGSGTGKFLKLLKQVSSNIIAIEPVAEMLEQLKIVHPEVHTLQAKSDQIPLKLASIDAVLCAQSFHWFADIKTLNQIHQILRPDGHLGLVWNQRNEDIIWVKALADLIATYEGDTPRFHSGQWKAVFEQQSLFKFQSMQVFSQDQTGTVEQVVSQRFLSTSFIAAMPVAQQMQLKQKFEDIVLQHTGKSPQDEIDFPYVTYAYHYKKLAF